MRTLIESDPALEVVADVGNVGSIPKDLPDFDVVLSAAESFNEDEIEEIQSAVPDGVGFLVLSDDASILPSLLDAEISSWGLLQFNADIIEIKAALHAVSAGLVVVSPIVINENAETAIFLSGVDSVDALIEPLTPRELEVLQLLSIGYPNKRIAAQLVISEHTVKFHISSIYGKLGAANRAEAVRLGVIQGLISV